MRHCRGSESERVGEAQRGPAVRIAGHRPVRAVGDTVSHLDQGRRRDALAETFPLPRSSFKLLRLILIGYLHEGGNDRKPSGPSTVGRAVGLDATLVSRNNAALAALGLLEPAENRRWRLTEGGVTVSRALEYEAQDDAREALAAIFRNHEFVQRVVTYVRAQGGVEEAQVVTHIARTAGVKRSSEFLTGGRALLELIETAGLLENDGGAVRVPPRRDSDSPEKVPGDRAPGQPRMRSYWQTSGARDEATGGVYITLHLNLSPSDLKTDAAADELGGRIKRLLDALQSA